MKRWYDRCQAEEDKDRLDSFFKEMISGAMAAGELMTRNWNMWELDYFIGSSNSSSRQVSIVEKEIPTNSGGAEMIESVMSGDKVGSGEYGVGVEGDLENVGTGNGELVVEVVDNEGVEVGHDEGVKVVDEDSGGELSLAVGS